MNGTTIALRVCQRLIQDKQQPCNMSDAELLVIRDVGKVVLAEIRRISGSYKDIAVRCPHCGGIIGEKKEGEN